MAAARERLAVLLLMTVAVACTPSKEDKLCKKMAGLVGHRSPRCAAFLASGTPSARCAVKCVQSSVSPAAYQACLPRCAPTAPSWWWLHNDRARTARSPVARARSRARCCCCGPVRRCTCSASKVFAAGVARCPKVVVVRNGKALDQTVSSPAAQVRRWFAQQLARARRL